jgi:hypothetical protein
MHRFFKRNHFLIGLVSTQREVQVIPLTRGELNAEWGRAPVGTKPDLSTRGRAVNGHAYQRHQRGNPLAHLEAGEDHDLLLPSSVAFQLHTDQMLARRQVQWRCKWPEPAERAIYDHA